MTVPLTVMVFPGTQTLPLFVYIKLEGTDQDAAIILSLLLLGVSLMDSAMVVLGAGAHRVSERFLRILGDVLAAAMGVLGVWLIVRGIVG